MSPEVYLFQPYDNSCDIWALGMIFYELAMMKYALSPNDKARILNANLEFIPPVIDCARRRYDVRVQQLLETMLQRDPKRRASIEQICNHPLLTSMPFYSILVLEDKQAMYDSFAKLDQMDARQRHFHTQG
jgi:serine/threonine protein kinase